MHLKYLYSLFWLLALHGISVEAAPRDAILLSKVESLTLYGGRPTTHRRVPAIPQLRCVSPRKLCALAPHVDVMRCVNQGAGWGGPEDVQWACTATLPAAVKLGGTEVICEGYSGPDDPYVLRGSCGVEYRLVLTDEGERRYPDLGGGESDWAGWVFMAVFFAIVAWIIWGACTAQNRGFNAGPAPRRRGNGGGGGGGGGWGPGGGGGGGPYDDPPPPYPGTKPDQQEGWRPGFWSGAATGAAAGYMAGRYNNNNHNNRNENYNDGGWWGGRQDYGGTWGSGGRWGSGSRSSSRSAQPQESTGFGSTSRR